MLLRAADDIKRQMNAVLEPHDLTGQQYNVLRILRGSASGALPTLEIAARLLEQTPGITRLLDRLENKGLVTRERATNDRRKVFCRMTEAGLELLGRLDEPITEANARALAPLGESERATLLSLLCVLDSKPPQTPEEHR